MKPPARQSPLLIKDKPSTLLLKDQPAAAPAKKKTRHIHSLHRLASRKVDQASRGPAREVVKEKIVYVPVASSGNTKRFGKGHGVPSLQEQAAKYLGAHGLYHAPPPAPPPPPPKLTKTQKIDKVLNRGKKPNPEEEKKRALMAKLNEELAAKLKKRRKGVAPHNA